MRLKLRWVWLAALILVCCPRTLEAGLQVGWSRADITPDFQVQMRSRMVSKGVMDRQTATVLALRSGEGPDAVRTVLISCDLQHITDGNRWDANMRDDVRALVVKAVPELRPEQIVLMATHTHVAASVHADEKYNRFATQRIAEAVEEAWKNLQPGGISYGLSHAVVGHNRITTYRDGSSHMTGSLQRGSAAHPGFSHIEGFEDHSVHLLFTWDRQSNLSGVVVNIACPAQVQRGDLLSADFWHETREMLAERLGPDVFILPQLSAAGDLATTVMVERKGEERMQRILFPEITDSSLARRMQLAVRIADAVSSIVTHMGNHIEWNPVLLHEMESLDLPQGFPEPDPTGGVFPVELHAIRISDIVMVTNPFELYLDYGIRIKGKSQAVQTFVVQLAGSASYLPVERSVAGGGYGAIERTCIVGPAAGDLLVDATLKLIDGLWE